MTRLLRHPRYARPVAAILADNKTAWERHWRVLLLRHPRYARPVAAILADNKTAWERHWRVLLLRHPRYARLMAAILADNKTAFCHSRTLCEESPCIQMSRVRSTWQRKWLPNGYNWLLSACFSVLFVGGSIIKHKHFISFRRAKGAKRPAQRKISRPFLLLASRKRPPSFVTPLTQNAFVWFLGAAELNGI